MSSTRLCWAKTSTQRTERGAEAVMTGTGPDGYLGTTMALVSDGTQSYLVGSEFGPDAVGRLMAVPAGSIQDGRVATYATLDITGDESGGYCGTGAVASGGQLWISCTAQPRLLSSPVSVLAGGDITAFTENPQVAPALDARGYLYMGLAGGADGFLAVSFGGFWQHFLPDGTPDWWGSLDSGDGTGLMPVELWEGRDLLVSCSVRRLTDDYAVTCLGVMTGASKPTSTTRVDPTTGAWLGYLPGVTSIVEGVSASGAAWHAEFVYDYISVRPAQAGYIQVFDSDNQIIVGAVPTPLADDGKPYNCVGMMEQYNGQIVIGCKYDNVGFQGMLTGI